MTSIDHIITKLNINSVDLGDSGQSSDDVELRIQDVFAALGLGHLPPESCYIGLAVSRKDEVDMRMANIYAARISAKVIESEGWSCTRPYQTLIRSMVNKGIIDQAEAAQRKESWGALLKFNLGKMALYELCGPHITICPRCHGAGTIPNLDDTKRRCHHCHGHCRVNEQPLNDTQRANRVKIKYKTWTDNWRSRYQIIQGEMNVRIGEFYAHLEKKC